ncbi:antifreeze protein [Primorskyibacter sedentarius]|uniref:Antifreeze protein n=1 Tax=Primorskyibacter sedentarius TaxID=745311 RepID=A0A4R3JMN6_9RHOB|nr:antifreeze protein [Primorskyibacter sedentarius]TCS66305.1 hypothetical protein EDD52_102122 [Primorskyibacter sedentarius]
MFRAPSPFDLLSNVYEVGMLLAEANAVITMRMLGMAGLWSVTPGENNRMVSEKIEALNRSVTAANRAAMTGQRPDQIAAAALKPMRQKTRANSKRLAKRGPKIG